MKLQYTCLLLALAVAFAASVVIDINSQTDEGLEKINKQARENGKTVFKNRGGTISGVSFSDNYLVGEDSWIRTGNSSLEIQGSLLKFNFHYGLGMWVQVFPSMKIKGEDMSVVFRIRDNSIHLGFTVHNNTKCSVTLDDIQYERLTNVEFSASRPKYDGIDKNKFFQNDVRGFLNKAFNSQKKQIEKGLQYVCKYIPHEEQENLLLLPLLMLDHLTGVFSVEGMTINN